MIDAEIGLPVFLYYHDRAAYFLHPKSDTPGAQGPFYGIVTYVEETDPSRVNVAFYNAAGIAHNQVGAHFLQEGEVPGDSDQVWCLFATPLMDARTAKRREAREAAEADQAAKRDAAEKAEVERRKNVEQREAERLAAAEKTEAERQARVIADKAEADRLAAEQVAKK